MKRLARAQMLAHFNAELRPEPPYRDLRNAADALQDRIADNGMMKLLKEQFTVSNVTADMVDLLRYLWQAVYTTNYDDALELAAKADHRPIETLNNTDDPDTASLVALIIVVR